MGVSTDAMLYYGINLHDEAERPVWSDDFCEGMELEPLEDLAKRLNELDPDYGWEELFKRDNVGVGIHCCDQEPMYFLAVGPVTTAARGYPESITMGDLATPEGAKHIVRAVEIMGVKDPKIGWWLASYWG